LIEATFILCPREIHDHSSTCLDELEITISQLILAAVRERPWITVHNAAQRPRTPSLYFTDPSKNRVHTHPAAVARARECFEAVRIRHRNHALRIDRTDVILVSDKDDHEGCVFPEKTLSTKSREACRRESRLKRIQAFFPSVTRAIRRGARQKSLQAMAR